MSVYCEWEDPDNDVIVGVHSNISSSAVFSGIYSKAKLYVPNGTTSLYEAQSWTSYFNSIEEYTPDSVTETPVQCAAPTISFDGNRLVFSSDTEGAAYHYTITCDDVCSNAYSSDGIAALVAAYNISVYASADGYANSETATATLYFVNATFEKGENEETDVISVPSQRAIVVKSSGNMITVNGLDAGEYVEVYNLNGVKIATAVADYDSATVPVDRADNVVIVRIGNQSLKVKL